MGMAYSTLSLFKTTYKLQFLSILKQIQTMPEKTDKAVRIWKTVQAIPKGKVAGYGQVADLAGLPGRARYVSRALKTAPSSAKLPWHRVLRSSGHIAFKPGSEPSLLQTKLLSQEGVSVINNRVDLKTFQWQPELSEILSTLEF